MDSRTEPIEITEGEFCGVKVFFIREGDTVQFQRRRVEFATDNPLSIDEKLIIRLCERILYGK